MSMPNHLVCETSPYLRQHQDNPVDWYPWGEEALSLAREENKPIFLSIGYAACHWCHVMAHESFENPLTAKILNDKYISIKVDREERPDLDDVYMQAVVFLTGQGGWPISVFLTPDLQPFYGGTYFPPAPRHGLPAFNQVLQSVSETWIKNQDTVINNAQALTQAIQAQHSHQEETTVDPPDLTSIVTSLYETYDWINGGWGQAPKFPQPMLVEFLIQRGLAGDAQAIELVEHVLDSMARGGLCDLVGGGFHRYSTDSTWLVPHFEKMLYDNAQLALTYLHGFSLTGNIYFRQVAIHTLQFIQRELTSPDGGFYASLDADTPEGEGRYYAWQLTTLHQSLSKTQFERLQEVMRLSQSGNFEDELNILQYKSRPSKLIDNMNISATKLQIELEPIFDTLMTIRSKKTPPGRDEKVITAWNAMAITAFAHAGLLLDRTDFLSTARNAADFILNELQTESGHLQRSWSQGKASQPGTLADFAGMILALHALYEVDFSPEVFEAMSCLHQVMQEEFSSEQSLYFDAGARVSDLIVRPQSLQDNAIPSGNALAAHTHWLFGNYEHNPADFDQLSKMIAVISPKLRQYPTSFGHWLRVIDLAAQKNQQIALVTKEEKNALQPFLTTYRNRYRPHSVIAAKFSDAQPEMNQPRLLKNRPAINGKPTAYICFGFTCHKPLTESEAFKKQLNQKL
jgi:uncharacterized protein